MIHYINMKYGHILILLMLHSNLKSQKCQNLPDVIRMTTIAKWSFNTETRSHTGDKLFKSFFFLCSVTFLTDMDSLIVDLDKVLDDFEAEGEGLKFCFLYHDHVVLMIILCLKSNKWNKSNGKI